MTKIFARLMTGLMLIAGGLLVTTAPAMADVISDGSTSCFGNPGTFIPGSRVLQANWNGTGGIDECFGVAPNRAIYHTWPATDRWWLVPGRGRVDDMLRWSRPNFTSGNPTITGYVAQDRSHWYTYRTSDGWAGYWIRCPINVC